MEFRKMVTIPLDAKQKKKRDRCTEKIFQVYLKQVYYQG